jgi:hypothetical protein
MPPFDAPPQSFVSQVIESSRAQFGKPRAQVEDDIRKWNESDPPEAAASKAPKRDFMSQKVVPAKPVMKSSPNPVVEQGSPRPTPPPVRTSEPVRSAEVKVIAEKIAHQHELAASRAASDQPRPRREERVVEDVPPPPPLEGSQSLRDALAQITGKPAAPAAPQPAEPPQQKGVHAPDLRATLHNLAPKAEASAPKPAELPEAVMREMLAVDAEEENYFERPDK